MIDSRQNWIPDENIEGNFSLFEKTIKPFIRLTFQVVQAFLLNNELKIFTVNVNVNVNGRAESPAFENSRCREAVLLRQRSRSRLRSTFYIGNPAYKKA